MEGTPSTGPRRGFLAGLIDLIDDHVTAKIDRDARERGLTVTRIPGTRTHRYRDSRWDRRRLCGDCAGSGCVGARPCGWCDGTGVVTLDPARTTGDPR